MDFSESTADCTIPKKAALPAIIRLWEERNPGWKSTKSDYRQAASLWDDSGHDLEVVADIIDRGLALCDSDRFWARNRTIRFIASRVDEILNLGEELSSNDDEWVCEQWVQDVAIPCFPIDDRGGLVRYGRRALGSFGLLRAFLQAQLPTAGTATDDSLREALKGAAKRIGRPGTDAVRPGSGVDSPGHSLF